MTTVNDALKKIKDGGVKYLDLRFTDPRGKLQHLTMDCSVVDESLLKNEKAALKARREYLKSLSMLNTRNANYICV
mgnify:CR=1 FL=1